MEGILESEALRQYIFETSGYPRENVHLKELREATKKKFGALSRMSIPVDVGLFFSMLLKILKAKRTLEIGVFTGYSLLCAAQALPEDGQATGIDKDLEAYELGLPYIKNAGVEHKINYIHSDADLVLDEMLSKDNPPEFDFILVDADKLSYKNFHEKLLKLVRVGGIIAYDNTLWYSLVVKLQEVEVSDYVKKATKAILEFNKFLSADPRIEIAQVSMGDGVTLCRRL